MNKRSKGLNPWNRLSFMLVGIALFEATSRTITHLEANGDKGSFLYHTLLTFSTIGLMIAIHCLLSIYIHVKQGL